MLFRSYIDRIVGRYKDDPTIMSWMIMNEADTGDKDGLYTFASVLSAQIKALPTPDYRYMTDNDVALKEWWDKEFKG